MKVKIVKLELYTQQEQEQNKDILKQNLEFAIKKPSKEFKRICFRQKESDSIRKAYIK